MPDVGAKAPPADRRIYLASPWAPMGGGMYKVADYLVQSQRAPEPGDREHARLVPLETRGGRGPLWSMLVICGALARILRARISGDLAGVHINVAERLSLFRKGLIVVLGRLIGVPTVLHLHAAQLPQTYASMSGVKQRLTRWMFRLTPAVIVLGESARQFVVTELGVPSGRVQVIANGVPGPEVVPARVSSSPGGAALRLLFVGNLSERKGVGDLLAALAAARATPGHPQVTLTLIGGGASDGYRAQAQTLGIAAATEFAGWQSQEAIARAMVAADALVLPSYDEGLPLVILEALAHALPVICTPVGEIGQHLTDERDAVFVQPGDRTGLAAALIRLANEPALRAQLGTQGRGLYEARFELGRFFDRIADVHRDVFGVAALRRETGVDQERPSVEPATTPVLPVASSAAAGSPAGAAGRRGVMRSLGWGAGLLSGLLLGLPRTSRATGMPAQTRPASARATAGASGAATAAQALPPSPASASVIDAAYAADFRLPALAADPIAVVNRPPARSASLAEPAWIDPAYGTRVFRATAAADYPGATFVRHEYSRKQAFNADGSRYLATTSNGHWLLYDTASLAPLKRRGPAGALVGMAGDAEPIWHPTDPNLLWYNARDVGLLWRAKQTETDRDTVLVDFRGRLPWKSATRVWTRGEGRCSADGRYFAFIASHYDAKAGSHRVDGLLTWDRVENQVVGTLDASEFGGVLPDHIAVTPSGRFVVPSWVHRQDLGTRAYSRDFGTQRQLHVDSEHSDLAVGPQGEDMYVACSYRDSALFAMNIGTGQRFDLMRLYPAIGTSIGALHVSGLAYDRRGWVVVSTYNDNAEYGKQQPDPVLRPAHRKIMLLELKPGGRQLSVAHTRTAARYGGYFGEPQATISRDGRRILFASNFDDGGPPSSYLVLLPEQAWR